MLSDPYILLCTVWAVFQAIQMNILNLFLHRAGALKILYTQIYYFTLHC